MELIFSKSSKRYEIVSAKTLRGDYDEVVKDTAKAARFRWDPKQKCWWTSDLEKIQNIQDIIPFSKEVKAVINKTLKARKKSFDKSRAETSTLEIPSPDGLNYLPYQKAGIEFCLGKTHTLLADQMGLGKGIQAIGVMNSIKAKKVLVICPASLKINWQREIQKWLTFDRKVEIVNSSKKFPKEAEYVIINYDILKKNLTNLTRKWDLVVCDESHMIKSGTAIRTKAAIKIIKKAKKVLMLTGTPILNRPVELWTTLHTIAPKEFPSWRDYVVEFCGGHETNWGWDVKGATNLSKLQQKLRETVMIRRLKKDVLKELPKKRRQIIILNQRGFKNHLKKENKIQKEYTDKIKMLERQRNSNNNGKEFGSIVSELERLRRIEFEEISKARHEIALRKAPAVIDFAKELLESTDKIIVFAHHHDVIEKLKEGLKAFNPVTITGKTSMENRQKAVDDFQEKDSVKVVIGNIKAAGVGLTLTAAHVVLFAELDWVPGVMTQAEDRAHRMGQKDSVVVYHVVVDGSIDATQAHTLIRKQDVLDKALDHKNVYKKSEKNENESTKEEIRHTIANSITEDIKKSVRRNVKIQLSKGADITGADRIAIQRALQWLAKSCDKASTKDDRGFTAFDSDFGHSLASARQLSSKQAWYGKKMLKKYHRQIPENLYLKIFPKFPEEVVVKSNNPLLGGCDDFEDIPF